MTTYTATEAAKIIESVSGTRGDEIIERVEAALAAGQAES